MYVTTSVVEVTPSITGDIDAKATDRQRYDLIDRRVKERIAACEKGGQRCSVASFFDGLKYFEIAQMEIKDVRLVYAPRRGHRRVRRRDRQLALAAPHRRLVVPCAPTSARTANRRHSRKENVPFKPQHWLKVWPEGIKPGDLVFVTGYPGRTQRHQTYSEVKETTEWRMPRSIRLAEEQLAILDQLTKKDKAVAIKVAGRVQGLNNGLTNQKGMLEGLVKGGSLAKKQAQEKELEAWIAADPARQKKYGDVLPALNALQEEGEKTREQSAMLTTLAMSSSYLGAAQTLYRLSVERPKPDIDRDAGFQQRDWPRIREGQERMQRTIDATADRALLRWALRHAAALPADQRIAPLDGADRAEAVHA